MSYSVKERQPRVEDGGEFEDGVATVRRSERVSAIYRMLQEHSMTGAHQEECLLPVPDVMQATPPATELAPITLSNECGTGAMEAADIKARSPSALHIVAQASRLLS